MLDEVRCVRRSAGRAVRRHGRAALEVRRRAVRFEALHRYSDPSARRRYRPSFLSTSANRDSTSLDSRRAGLQPPLLAAQGEQSTCRSLIRLASSGPSPRRSLAIDAAIDVQQAHGCPLPGLKRAAMRDCSRAGCGASRRRRPRSVRSRELGRLVTLGELDRVVTGRHPNASQRAYWDGGTIPWAQETAERAITARSR